MKYFKEKISSEKDLNIESLKLPLSIDTLQNITQVISKRQSRTIDLSETRPNEPIDIEPTRQGDITRDPARNTTLFEELLPIAVVTLGATSVVLVSFTFGVGASFQPDFSAAIQSNIPAQAAQASGTSQVFPNVAPDLSSINVISSSAVSAGSLLGPVAASAGIAATVASYAAIISANEISNTLSVNMATLPNIDLSIPEGSFNNINPEFARSIVPFCDFEGYYQLRRELRDSIIDNGLPIGKRSQDLFRAIRFCRVSYFS